MPDSERLTGDSPLTTVRPISKNKKGECAPRHGDAVCRKFIKRKEVGQNANPSQGKTNKPQAWVSTLPRSLQFRNSVKRDNETSWIGKSGLTRAFLNLILCLWFGAANRRFTVDAIAEGSDIADAVWYFVAHAKNTTGAELTVDCGNMIQLYPVIPR